MNKHELNGGARYVAGKVEKTVGDVVDSRTWQVDGVVDQVAGGAEHAYGRARAIAAEVADATPGLIEEARERVGGAAARSAESAKRGGRAAADAVRGNPAVVWAVAAALGGLALGWLARGQRG
ncbi:hypothetical protein GCM10011380_09180 [Sphingomonas metalli]|uniref:CsbD family protein n=1 Tax=Sphingomonas metalli TaxID=1779358 RepID=A0A916SY51_9SPHN|nr:CsbD family protein [Sphingomonas metalli]GGB21761.1 hypothetical protein GCM10011380_09180 [Sphingomonas metalli]